MNLLKLTFTSLLVCLSGSLFSQTAGNALDFDGTGYVSASLPVIFNDLSNNNLTFEAWVKPEGSGTQRIFFAQLDASHFVSVLLNPSNTPYFFLSNGSTYSATISSSLPASQWSHLACTWEASTQNILIYVDGVLQPVASGGSSSTGIDNAMTIGSRTDGTQQFTGELDELRIWSDVRTNCQIFDNMHFAMSSPAPGVIAYYQFDQGTAGGNNTSETTLADLTGNYTGTLNNFTLNGTTSNWIESGVSTSSSGSNATVENIPLCSGSDYTYPDGTVSTNLTADETHTSTLQSVSGCDSLVQTNITVNPVFSTTQTESVCSGESYTYPDGTVSTNILADESHTSNFQAVSGCDSTIITNLSVNTPDTSITMNGILLTANSTSGTFQWYDCQTQQMLNGETNATFTPQGGGMFAVQVTENGCSAFSNCYIISILGLQEHHAVSARLYPNPVVDHFFLESNVTGDLDVRITDLNGKELVHQTYSSDTGGAFEVQFNEPAGVYLVYVSGEQFEQVFRLVKR